MSDEDASKKRYRWNLEEARVSPAIYVCQIDGVELRYSRQSVKSGVKYTFEYRGQEANFSIVWGGGTKKQKLSAHGRELVRQHQGALGRSINGLPQGLRTEGKNMLANILGSSDRPPRAAPDPEYLARIRKTQTV